MDCLRILVATWVLAASLSGCVLPSYERVGGDDPAASSGACGLSNLRGGACGACIDANCCAEASACGSGTACGDDMAKPITPVTQFSTDFDPVLTCMQNRCEEACAVHWGCVDNYEWPKTPNPVTRDVRVVQFGIAATPLQDVTVQACGAFDPSPNCEGAEEARALTNAEGVAQLTLPGTFSGMYRFRKKGVLSSTANWSEPAHRIAGFTQFQLTPVLLSAFANLTGVPQPFDPTLGHMIARAHSCLPLRYLDGPLYGSAPDVQFTLDEYPGASQVFYTGEKNEVSVARDRTSEYGYGGVFNLPRRNIMVSAIDTHTGQEVASGVVLVVEGGMAFLHLMPRSRP